MKKHKSVIKAKLTVLGQICKLIPGHLVSKLARKYGVGRQARKFTPRSHVVSLLYAQLVHAVGFNDVCDGLREGEIALFDKACVNFVSGQHNPSVV